MNFASNSSRIGTNVCCSVEVGYFRASSKLWSKMINLDTRVANTKIKVVSHSPRQGNSGEINTWANTFSRGQFLQLSTHASIRRLQVYSLESLTTHVDKVVLFFRQDQICHIKLFNRPSVLTNIKNMMAFPSKDQLLLLSKSLQVLDDSLNGAKEKALLWQSGKPYVWAQIHPLPENYWQLLNNCVWN